MKPVERLHKERERNVKAVDAGLEQHEFLKEETEAVHVFPTWHAKDLYANKLLQHRATTAEIAEREIGPPTKTILERIRLRKEAEKQRQETDFEEKRQQLTAAGIDVAKQEDKLARRNEHKPLNLKQALDDDVGLENMPLDKVIKQFTEEGRLANTYSNKISLDQFVANKDKFKPNVRSSKGVRGSNAKAPNRSKTAALGDTSIDEEALDQVIGNDPDADDDDDDSDALSMEIFDSDEEEEKKFVAPIPFTGPRGAKAAAAASNTESVLKQLKASKEGGGNKSGTTLNTLIAALKAEIPLQEEALRALKEEHSVVQTRLNWATQRPDTYKQGSTTYSGGTRGMFGSRLIAHEILEEVFEMTWGHIMMRPKPEEVAAEVHTWKAERHPALMAIARHISDGVFKDCVDELISEMAEDVLTMQDFADTFSFDIIVEAVAFSQAKFDFRGDDVRSRLNALSRETQNNLESAMKKKVDMAESQAQSRSMRGDDMQSRGFTHSVRRSSTFNKGKSGVDSDLLGNIDEGTKSDDEVRRSDNKKSGKAREGGNRIHFADDSKERGAADDDMDALLGELPDDEEDLLAREEDVDDLAQTQTSYGPTRLRQRGNIKLGADLAEDLDEADVYLMHRQFDDTEQGPHQDKDLYIKGLKAMLQEMRKRRGDSPYGHTQQLAMHYTTELSREEQKAVAQMQPALAAGAAVWKRRTANSRRAPLANYPRHEHMMVAMKEHRFWCKVQFRPFFFGVNGLPLIDVTTNKKEQMPISAMKASPSGAFLAVGTTTGVMLVYDLRNDPVNPWFRVQGTGPVMVKRGFFRRRPPPNPAIYTLSWSCDSYQLASLDASSILRVWWMRPESGQVVLEEPLRQPVVPELAMAMGPLMCAISGKIPISESVNDDSLTTSAAKETALVFQKEFNFGGTQPSIVIPQVTGDLLRVTTKMGFKMLPLPLPPSLLRAVPIIEQQTVDFLMPPQVPNTDQINTQSIFRGHNGLVVYTGYLSDGTTMVSVDHRGVVNFWPSYEGDRTGFGWFVPRTTWKLPQKIYSHQARGMLHPVWPRKPEAVTGFTLFGLFTRKAPVPTTTKMTFDDLMSDRDLHDSPNEPELLEEYPMGNFLVESRMLWLVRYRQENKDPRGKDPKKVQVIREEIHRPSQELGTGGKALVISAFDQVHNTFMCRYKQYAVYAKLEYKVVAAVMSPSQRDLLIWTSVPSHPGDADSFLFFACHVLNLEAMRPLTPRIDVYDHSQGRCAPAFAVTPTVSSLGTEYMLVGLGCGIVAVFSVATGHMVKELALRMPTNAAHFTALQLFQISSRQGIGKNTGKMILAAVSSDSMSVFMYEINDELGTVETMAQRRSPTPPRPVPGCRPAGSPPEYLRALNRVSSTFDDPAKSMPPAPPEPTPAARTPSLRSGNGTESPFDQRYMWQLDHSVAKSNKPYAGSALGPALDWDMSKGPVVVPVVPVEDREHAPTRERERSKGLAQASSTASSSRASSSSRLVSPSSVVLSEGGVDSAGPPQQGQEEKMKGGGTAAVKESQRIPPAGPNPKQISFAAVHSPQGGKIGDTGLDRSATQPTKSTFLSRQEQKHQEQKLKQSQGSSPRKSQHDEGGKASGAVPRQASNKGTASGKPDNPNP